MKPVFSQSKLLRGPLTEGLEPRPSIQALRAQHSSLQRLGSRMETFRCLSRAAARQLPSSCSGACAQMSTEAHTLVIPKFVSCTSLLNNERIGQKVHRWPHTYQIRGRTTSTWVHMFGSREYSQLKRGGLSTVPNRRLEDWRVLFAER